MNPISLHQLLNAMPENLPDDVGWQRIEVAGGQELFRQGDPADQLWVLREGRVAVLVDGTPVDEVEPGEILGEAAIFFTGGERSAGCVALVDVEAWVLDRGALDRLRERGDDLYDRTLKGVLAETWERIERKNLELLALAGGESRSPGPTDLPSEAQTVPDNETSTAPTAAALLRQVPVLGLGDEEAMEQLAVHLDARFVPGDQALFLQGDGGDEVYFVADGEFDIMRKAEGDTVRTLARVGPGAIIGSGSFISLARRSASALAREDSWVFSVSRRVLDDMPRVPRRSLLEALLTTAHGQLHDMNKLVEEARLSQ